MDIYNISTVNDPAFQATFRAFNPNKDTLDEFLSKLHRTGRPTIPVREISLDEGRDRANRQSTSIWASYRSLKQTYEPISAQVHQFWRKQTAKQREAFLKKAWGAELPRVHRPDLVAYLSLVTNVDRTSITMRYGADDTIRNDADTLRLPQINYEALAGQVDSLPSLMESRARDDPCAFWKDDLGRQALGQFLLTRVFIPCVAMSFVSEHGYGHPTSFEKGENAQEIKDVLTFQSKTSGEGFLILDAQERLYNFLDNMAGLLRKALAAVPAGMGSTTQVVPPRVEPTRQEYLDMIMDEPYTRTMPEDITQLCQLALAHMKAAEDHLWKLRENPHYYREAILEQIDHHWGWVHDKDGNKFLGVDKFSLGNTSKTNNVIWGWAILKTLASAVLFCEMWNEVFQYLSRIAMTVEDPANQGNDVPMLEAYVPAAYFLRKCLQTLVGLSDGGEMFFSHPQMRDIMLRTTPPDTTLSQSNRSTFAKRMNQAKDEDRDRLIRTFQLLSVHFGISRAGLRNLTSYAMFLSEGKATTEKGSEVGDRFSPLASKFLGDLSSMTEILYQVELVAPSMVPFNLFQTEELLDERFYAENAFGKVMDRLANISRTPDSLSSKIVDFGSAANKHFEYPIDMPPNKKRKEQIKAAEKRLDNLWDLVLKEKLFTEATPYLKVVIATQKISRTLARAEESTLDPGPSGSQQVPGVTATPFGGKSQQEQPGWRAPALPKGKEKTRGPAGEEQSGGDEGGEDDEEMEEAPIVFEVDKNGWDMASKLFHMPGEKPSGSAKWTDFLRLMTTMGFGSRKLGGSAWEFRPEEGTALAGRGSVIVHEPHKAGAGGRQLTFQYARVDGDMLRHRYGITGTNFVLKQ